MKRLIYLFITFLFLVFFNNTLVYASEINMYGDFHFINKNNEIRIYKNNIHYETIYDSKFLDSSNEYFIYNTNNNLWLYDLKKSSKVLIATNVYNAMITDDFIIYESDKNTDYTCRNLVGDIIYRNCYKLYQYDIKNNEETLIKLNGSDNYLNDVSNSRIVYTSIHTRDSLCSSICSYINIYDYKTMENILVNEYEELVLDMSGNAFIDGSIVYFESVPNLYDCNKTQIFYYNLDIDKMNLLTIDDNMCFNENSQILDASDGYVIFSSSYKNYLNNKEINYIYSYIDNKYSRVVDECIYEDEVMLCDNNLCLLVGDSIQFYPLDNISPEIDTTLKYTALLEKEEKLLAQLVYSDNLTSNNNLSIKLLDNIDEIGEKLIEVELCDKFMNCSLNEILVNVIDIDLMPPKIYLEDSITIKRNEMIIIDKYGYAIDNVDGKLNLNIVGENKYSEKGTYILLVESRDSSGNIAYKEIEVTVYDNLKILTIYLIVIVITIFLIIIIYILRFKKYRGF